MKPIKYHKIPQFKDVISSLSKAARFDGLDDDGNPVYNNNPLPYIIFNGTVKLHGTNASIRLTDGNIYYQSRNKIVTGGHFDFVKTMNETKDLLSLFNQIEENHNIDTSKYSITIYGEWAGKGIQDGVAISELPKSFYIVDVKITNQTTQEESYYIENYKIDTSKFDRIFNIENFERYEIEIDFANPKRSINELIELINKVERCCPVAKSFGIEGIGEGVVWKTFWKGNKYIFKVKGEKHSVSKVKKLVEVDVEKMENIDKFAEKHVTENRMDQCLKELNITKDKLSRKLTGHVIKWMKNDILSENNLELTENNISGKEAANAIGTKARVMYFKRIDDSNKK